VSPKLAIELDKASFGSGDPVSGSVNIIEGGKSRSLSLQLVYREKTADVEDAELELPATLLHQGDLETGGTCSFTVVLPDDAPPAYASEHGEMYWCVVARSDEFGPDTVLERRVEVETMPRG
jgi:hypothetical protein